MTSHSSVVVNDTYNALENEENRYVDTLRGRKVWTPLRAEVD